MSSWAPKRFNIIEHQIPCQNIREYPGATLYAQEDVLHLSVKQYVPWDNVDPQPGDVTILAAHANGVPKELYEPLWEETIRHAETHGFRIRAIWISDVAHQGQSGILNEGHLGNDPSWFDHSRDLLNLINIKRKDIVPPIVGYGHSMGGSQLVHLSLMHPRLFHSLVLLEPVLQRPNTRIGEDDLFTHDRLIFPLIQKTTYRRDTWSSRTEAADFFRRSTFYKAWDKRVLQNWIKYGLRDSASSESLNQTSTVTLATPYYREVTGFGRPVFNRSTKTETISHPDLDPALLTRFPFYHPAPSQIFTQLPHVRPSVLYTFARKSPLCLRALCEDQLHHTGTGAGGSGGIAAGRVRATYLEGIGHLAAQESPQECAKQAVVWMGPEIKRWQEEQGRDGVRRRLDASLDVAGLNNRQRSSVPGPPACGSPGRIRNAMKSKF